MLLPLGGQRARRVYTLMLFVALVWLVVDAGTVMEWFGDEGGGIGRTPCSDIAETSARRAFALNKSKCGGA